MRHLLTLYLIWVCSFTFGQRATKLSDLDALVFNNGFHAITTSKAMYFNAFDHRNGWQIFCFDGKAISQVSHFSTKADKDHEDEKLHGGGLVNWAVVFQDEPVFYVSGKTVENGLYRIRDQKLVKIHGHMDDCSQGFVLKNQLHITEFFTEDNLKYSRNLTIQGDWQLTKGKQVALSTSTNPTLQTVVAEQEAYGILNGSLMKWSKNGFASVLNEYKHVQNPFAIDQTLYFTGLKKGEKELYLFSYHKDGTVKKLSNIYPGKMMLTVQPPLREGDHVYFIADPEGKALCLYKVSGDKVDFVATLTTNNVHRAVQGLDVCHGQIYVDACGVKDEHFDLVQVSGDHVVTRNPGRLTDIKGAIIFQDHLVYMATDRGHDAVFTSDPVLPPNVQNDTFKIFDFWQNSRVLGKVKVLETESSTRLRYKMVSEEKLFAVDYTEGTISVANHSTIRDKAGSNIVFKVEVTNEEGFSSTADILVQVAKSKKMETSNLHETFMFFPDFNRRRTLITHALPDGQIIGVFDLEFAMIDEIRVQNKAIVLGEYPPGVYFLNTSKGKNLYQKIELR